MPETVAVGSHPVEATTPAGGDGVAIEVPDLRKHGGEVRAVDSVDLTVRTGEIFALLGPNGAGKTTAVEMLEGYRRRDGGEIRVLGLDPGRHRPALEPRIGIVLQSIGVEPYLTVAGTVRMCARYYPHPRPVDAVARTVGLDDLATGGSTASRAARSAGPAWPSPSSATPSCCCSTSRPPASTRPPGGRRGTRSGASPRSARPSCCPASSSPSATGSPTGSCGEDLTDPALRRRHPGRVPRHPVRLVRRRVVAGWGLAGAGIAAPFSTWSHTPVERWPHPDRCLPTSSQI
jgi:hypothetical protein